MASIFLGKAWHWLLFLVVGAVFWVTGVYHLHVSAFNIFIAITGGLSLLLVFAVLLDYRPGDHVTREPLPEPDDD